MQIKYTVIDRWEKVLELPDNATDEDIDALINRLDVEFMHAGNNVNQWPMTFVDQTRTVDRNDNQIR